MALIFVESLICVVWPDGATHTISLFTALHSTIQFKFDDWFGVLVDYEIYLKIYECFDDFGNA